MLLLSTARLLVSACFLHAVACDTSKCICYSNSFDATSKCLEYKQIHLSEHTVWCDEQMQASEHTMQCDVTAAEQELAKM